MARIHLFEFEDLRCFPSVIRNYMTDFLQFVANKFDFYSAIIPILEKGLESTKHQRIIDLASGGGGGWMKLSEHLAERLPDIQVHLTDFYPNVNRFEEMVSKKDEMFSYSKESIDARNVPEDLKGLRTQFLSIHHFQPKDVQAILENAIESDSPIALFEAQKRSVKDFIQFFFSPINVLLSTPFIRPFQLGRILFTYLIPVVPVVTWWDGLVSVLRTYSKEELEEIILKIEGKDSFEWEIDSVKKGPITIYYLLGIPKN